MIKLFNTLSKEKEEFKPEDPSQVGMYNCGPTVYNYAHIGNLRAYVFADILKRTLEFNNFKVRQVINITDVGHLTDDADEGKDKVEERARKEGRTADEITQYYTETFFRDLDKLNIDRSKITFPKATEHIKEQIKLIKELEKKGLAYKTSDGIYFDTFKYKDYGKLGRTSPEQSKQKTRININSQKKNVADFALWKFSPPSGGPEKRQQEWDSPWGVGFPGWHIECSAISMKYLGESFDIHTGGMDHIPVHHTNEIAQSESVTGKPLANYWLHNAFVVVPNGKMSKSLDNFLNLEAIEEKKINPLALRYWYLGTHYRSPLKFSWPALKASQSALEKLKATLSEMPSGGKVLKNYLEKFKEAINDDLGTPGALALTWKLLKARGVSRKDKKATILEFDKVLGLDLKSPQKTTFKVPPEIKKLSREREKARKEKNFKKADELREKIEKEGWQVKDTEKGPVVTFDN